jgi:hypothetical protein
LLLFLFWRLFSLCFCFDPHSILSLTLHLSLCPSLSLSHSLWDFASGCVLNLPLFFLPLTGDTLHFLLLTDSKEEQEAIWLGSHKAYIPTLAHTHSSAEMGPQNLLPSSLGVRQTLTNKVHSPFSSSFSFLHSSLPFSPH